MKRTPKHSVGLTRPVDPKNPDAGTTTVYFPPGEPFDLSREEAAFLDERGALEPVDNSGRSAKKAAAPEKPKGKALTQAIVAQIAMFDPDSAEAFNRDGKPAVAALERGLGFDINEADRDAGWEAYRTANPDLFKNADAAA